MKKILIFITTAILIAGCGSSGGSSSESTEDVTMVISETYTVYPGNQVLKGSPDTLVQITHIDGQTESTIQLLEGNATIIRKP